ncbi:MAG: protein-disulfide reductase DsbD domain-containing protein [Tepidisphaeraceae bacterium]
MNRWIPLLVVAVSACSVRHALAAPPANLVKAELLADASGIRPGRPFLLGVRFRITPGWHIYWINPGDSGEATRVEFQLPPGFVVGPVRYPAPEKFVQPGDIVGYGYEQQAMLIVEVTPAGDLKIGDEISVVANSTWLVCEKICIPGQATSSLRLPVSSETTAANAETFQSWQKRIPRTIDSHSAPKVAVQTLNMHDGKAASLLWLDAVESDLQAFPGPLEGAEVRLDPPLKSHHGTSMRVHVSALPGQTIGAKSLHVVLVSSTNAYDVTVPINPDPHDAASAQKR